MRVRVWDWTVRVFHWSLVLLVGAMWWTGEEGYMVWHKWLGVGLAALLVYRLSWGLIGPATARLTALIPKPAELVGYIRSLTTRPYVRALGHNPLGGLSVLALLALLTVQIGSGLFAVDVDGLASGWFGHVVSFDTGRAFSDFHEISFNALLTFIALHVIAVGLYTFVLRANLIGPMVTGYQSRDGAPDRYTPPSISPVRFGVSILAAAAVAGLIVWLGR